MYVCHRGGDVCVYDYDWSVLPHRLYAWDMCVPLCDILVVSVYGVCVTILVVCVLPY